MYQVKDLKHIKGLLEFAVKSYKKIGFIYVNNVYDTQDPDMPLLGKEIKFFLPIKK